MILCQQFTPAACLFSIHPKHIGGKNLKVIETLEGEALQRSTLRRKINREKHGKVSGQFMRWVRAGGHKLKGMVHRRAAEAELYVV